MLRVAAYCRVSTDKEDQIHSLESQKNYFYEYINRREDWELTNIYADEGITGTNTKKRLGFLNMLKAAHHHEIDLIITKEISRFARNTLDSIYYSRVLKELGVGIFFLNDNINTLDPDAELRLTILSSIAQEESRKTSERVKWGQKRSMERGVVFGRDLLGYDVREGKLYINEEGAEIVRLIFDKFVTEGKGTYTIAKELNKAGIPTLNHQEQWYTTVILRILHNEKYCGDLIQKKTYTPNYLEHKKKKNQGQEEKIIIEDHHEPIISREVFMKAQEELLKRTPVKENRQKYSNRYGLSGIIKCASCGSSYVFRRKKTKEGKVYGYWRCYEAVIHGKKHFEPNGMAAGCNNPTIAEDNLKEMIQDILKNLSFDKEAMIKEIQDKVQGDYEDIRSRKDLSRLTGKLDQCKAKNQRLIELYILKEIDKKEFQDLKEKFKGQMDAIQKEIEESGNGSLITYSNQENQGKIPPKDKPSQDKPLQDKPPKDKPPQDKSSQDNPEEFLKNILYGREWNETFYHRLLNQVLVYEEGKVEIGFKFLNHKFIYHVK